MDGDTLRRAALTGTTERAPGHGSGTPGGARLRAEPAGAVTGFLAGRMLVGGTIVSQQEQPTSGFDIRSVVLEAAG